LKAETPEALKIGKSQVKLKAMSRLNRKVQFAFGSALLTLLFVGAVCYRGIAASGESDRRVRHTQEPASRICFSP
jgi:CHASE3 domain sensor protein